LLLVTDGSQDKGILLATHHFFPKEKPNAKKQKKESTPQSTQTTARCLRLSRG
jgi:hypothetical protein